MRQLLPGKSSLAVSGAWSVSRESRACRSGRAAVSGRRLGWYVGLLCGCAVRSMSRAAPRRGRRGRAAPGRPRRRPVPARAGRHRAGRAAPPASPRWRSGCAAGRVDVGTRRQRLRRIGAGTRTRVRHIGTGRRRRRRGQRELVRPGAATASGSGTGRGRPPGADGAEHRQVGAGLRVLLECVLIGLVPIHHVAQSRAIVPLGGNNGKCACWAVRRHRPRRPSGPVRECRRDRRPLLHRRARQRRPGRARSSSPSPAATTGSPRPAGSSPPAGSTRAPRCCCARPSCPPPAPRGDLLDLGCGYGPIACVLADRAPPATVWAVDVNARARELTAAERRPARRWPTGSGSRPGRRAGRRRRSPRSGPTRRSGSARRSCTSCCCAGCPGSPRTASAWLVVARHLGGDSLQRWLRRAGLAGRAARQPEGLPGAAGHPVIRVDPARPRRAGCLTWDTWTWQRSGTSCPTAGNSSPTCRSGSARAPRSPWSGRTAPARRRCCGWSPATCRSQTGAIARSGGLGVMRQFIGMIGDEPHPRRPGAVAGPAARCGRPASGCDRAAERGRCTARQRRPSKAQLRVRGRAGRLGRGRRVRRRGALRHRQRRRARPAVGRSPGPAGADPVRRPAEAVRAGAAAARHRRGAAARRAGQLPRRAGQALAGGAAARVDEVGALRLARPGAAGPDRRPGGRRRGRHARGCTRAASPSWHEARVARHERLDELRRRWDEEHQKLQASWC